MVPILVKILALIQRQKLDQRFAIDPHPLLARAPDGFMRLFTGHMHNVQRHPSRIRNRDRAVGRLALQFWRTRICMPLRPSNTQIKILLLQLCDQITVFRMHHRQRTQFGTALERREHLVVLDHQCALVSHKMLERIDAHIDGIFHLVKDVLIPARDRHVIADVRANLRCRLAVPFVDRILDRPVRTGQTEIDNHRGATTGRCPCSAFECLRRSRAHKGHFQMRMRVDPAGDDIGTLGVDILIP